MAYKDPLDERARASRRKHYENNREQYYARNEKKRQELREYMQKAKDVPCADCDQRYPYYVMDFDHRAGTVKEYKPALLYTRSWKVLLAELEKCDVVCSNCHRMRTFARGQHLSTRAK